MAEDIMEGQRLARTQLPRNPRDTTGTEWRRLHQDPEAPPTVEELAKQIEELQSVVISLSTVIKGQSQLIHGNDDEAYVGILARLELLETGELA